MSNLRPELRQDVTGKMVTRHVKDDTGTAPKKIAAPPTVAHEINPAVVTLPKQRVVTIRPDRVDRAVKRLESANKRLDRAGMERFEWRVEQREMDMVPRAPGFGGLIEYVDVVDLVVDYPEIKTATHDFVGSLTQEETGLITRLSEDAELGDWRPRESYCDHCGTNRRRNFTVIVKDRETGEHSQVGSSCVEGYLGVNPSDLFSLGFDPLSEEVEDLEATGYKRGSFFKSDHKADVRKTLAVALVVSNDGRNYEKRTDYWQGIPSQRSAHNASTHGWVVAGLRDVDEDHPDYEWTQEVQKRAAERLEDGSVDAFVSGILNSTEDSEYINNLKILVSGDRCEFRNMGKLVSAVSVYQRMQNPKTEETEDSRVNEWLGAVGDKLTGMKATIERLRYSETAYGMSTIVTMRTESGHELTWFASNPPSLNQGDKVDIKATTIKKHDEWQGRKSTVVTRTKMEVTEEAPAPSDDFAFG